MFHLVAHVTLVLVLAFFVLFAAGKAEGFAKLLGTVLGWWLVVLAVLFVAAFATRPLFGGKPFGMDVHGMHRGWMHHADQEPAAPPAPAKPAGH